MDNAKTVVQDYSLRLRVQVKDLLDHDLTTPTTLPGAGSENNGPPSPSRQRVELAEHLSKAKTESLEHQYQAATKLTHQAEEIAQLKATIQTLQESAGGAGEGNNTRGGEGLAAEVTRLKKELAAQKEHEWRQEARNKSALAAQDEHEKRQATSIAKLHDELTELREALCESNEKVVALSGENTTLKIQLQNATGETVTGVDTSAKPASGDATDTSLLEMLRSDEAREAVKRLKIELSTAQKEVVDQHERVKEV